MIAIDKGIPVPAVNNGRSTAKWPFAQMQPGDSFFAAGCVQTNAQKKNGERIIAANNGKRCIPGSKWTSRCVVENGVSGVRIWRVA